MEQTDQEKKGGDTHYEHLKAPWLEKYKELRTISSACKAFSISRNVVARWRNNDPAFAEKFRDIECEAIDALEASAYQKALSGNSDILTIFLLKANYPEKYRDVVKHEIEHRFVIDITTQVLAIIRRIVPTEYHNPISEELKRLSNKLDPVK